MPLPVFTGASKVAYGAENGSFLHDVVFQRVTLSLVAI
jgi:hypothetical protein